MLRIRQLVLKTPSN